MNRWNLLFVTGMFASLFLPIILALSGKRWKAAAEEKARERRLAEHRMNARLLRLNL